MVTADQWLSEGDLGEEGEEDSEEAHRETLGTMYIFIFLVMHNSFMGMYNVRFYTLNVCSLL